MATASRPKRAGLVTAPPMSPLKVLRSLEKAYTAKTQALDEANVEIAKLRGQIQSLTQQVKTLVHK